MTDTPSFTTIIRADSTAGDYWRALWQYRELLYFLAWRDVLVRYKQTVIGVAWAVLRPLLTMGIFVLVFAHIAKLPTVGTVPYPILVFAALLPWQFFASSVASAAESLTGNSNMVSKVYFPRLIMPVSSIAPSIMDFMISLVILALLCVIYGFMPGWQIIALPFFMALLIVLVSGVGILLAALNVSYRDFRYAIPFLLQIGLYVSPVGYASATVPEHWRLLYALNPMVGIIDGFRWALLGGQETLYLPGLFLSVLVTSVIGIVGVTYFRRVELYFADRI